MTKKKVEEAVNALTDDDFGAGRGPMVSRTMLATLLNCTPEWVRRLTQDGILKSPRKHAEHGNLYILFDSVQAFLAYTKDETRRSSKSAAESRVTDARSREIELRIAVKEGSLIPLDEAMGCIDEVVGLYRSELSGLPARVTRDLKLRQTIETAVNDILDNVANAAAKKSSDISAGRSAVPSFAANAAGHMGGSEPEISEDGSDPRPA